MMHTAWQLQTAKSRFSEVMNETAHAPQFITRHGQPAAVLLSIEDYQQLTRPKNSLASFFQHSPLSGLDIPERDATDIGREVSFDDD